MYSTENLTSAVFCVKKTISLSKSFYVFQLSVAIQYHCTHWTFVMSFHDFNESCLYITCYTASRDTLCFQEDEVVDETMLVL